MKNYLAKVICGVAVATTFITATAHADEPLRPAKPNIVLILADDLGWQDVKCYDVDDPAPVETPNLDALATQGVMFWQAYSPAPTCAPSRCAIMSGNHPARAQKTHVVGGAPPVARSENSRMMDPWYSGRIPENELTIAKVLGQNGYTTGHSGKWHMAIDHSAFPQPKDVGFDFTRSTRGARRRMKNRLEGFATDQKGDSFRLDENGFPFHQTNEDALTFIDENKDKPFFLYYATWLVHSPIHTRSKELLDKYAKKLGVDPAKPTGQEVQGQVNPFYCAMVEELDYYIGVVIKHLEETDDPRWPGHKLSENTYLIFTSDNGGMLGGSKERYTDNRPLNRGKSSAMDGGTRVPLIITGPGIAKGVQTDVMANGLDFYPTILSMAGIVKPASKHLDGCDLLPLLLNDPKDSSLVKTADGQVRDTMVHHFPHGRALESSIRIGDYKLIRNYDYVEDPRTVPLELYQLYRDEAGKQVRVDIEELKNLADAMPEKAKGMNDRLTEILEEMEASYPYYNPTSRVALPHKESVPTVTSHKMEGSKIELAYRENGSKLDHADVIYTLNGGEKYEEWFRIPAKIEVGSKITATLPTGTTHYYVNLIDEHNFLVSYPKVAKEKGNRQETYAASALEAGDE